MDPTSVPDAAATQVGAREELRSSATSPNPAVDEITRLTAWVCHAPIALVTLLDDTGHRLHSATGIELPATWLDTSFSTHTVSQRDVLVIGDTTTDRRVAAAPLVTGAPHVRFYAGTPLVTSEGHLVGALGVMDGIARGLSAEEGVALRTLGRQVVAQLELRRRPSALEHANVSLRPGSGAESSTTLKDRTAFVDRLDEECQRVVRYARPLSLLVLSVNSFRGDFDQPAEDDLLEAIAQLLPDTARTTDVVGRLKEDEFAVLLTDTDQAGALVLAERSRQILAWGGWEHGPVRVHVGLASLTTGGTGASLLAEAHDALRRSQEAGSHAVSYAGVKQP